MSVVVRQTIVQLWTPDGLRGRVSAVNRVFVSSSNELGAFESGALAALIGPVATVVAGGIATIGIASHCAQGVPRPAPAAVAARPLVRGRARLGAKPRPRVPRPR